MIFSPDLPAGRQVEVEILLEKIDFSSIFFKRL